MDKSLAKEIKTLLRRHFSQRCRGATLAAAHSNDHKGKPSHERFFRCNGCKGELFVQTDVQVDHVKPIADQAMIAVIEGIEYTDWNTYVYSVFCGDENLQVLCHACHKLKTKAQGAERRKSK